MLTSLCLQAQSVDTLWANVPDSIVPLREKAEVTEKTDSFLAAKVSDAMSVQMRIVAHDDSQRVCIVKTYMPDTPSSVCSVYDLNWMHIKDIVFTVDDFIPKEKADNLRCLFDPVLISIALNGQDDNMKVQLGKFGLSDEENKLLEGLEMQKTVNIKALIFK